MLHNSARTARGSGLLVLATILSVTLAGAAHAQTGDYVEIDVATYPQGGIAAMNDLGQVVGILGGQPVVWEEGLAAALLPKPPGSNAFAWAINNLGQVLGISQGSSGNRVILWEDTGNGWSFTDLGPGYATFGINDAGVMTGRFGPGFENGLLSAGTFIPLDGPGVPFGLNNATPLTVMGYDVAGDTPLAWVDGDRIELPTLAGNGGRPLRVNDAGQIVGVSADALGKGQPVIWEGRAIEQLPLPAGRDSGSAWGINEAGEIAGIGSIASTGIVGRPLLWRDGTVVDLSTFGDGASAVCCGALDIDEFGQVVGQTRTAVKPWRPAQSEQRIENLRRVVERLGRLPGNRSQRRARGELSVGNVKALLAKLDAAEAALARGNNHGAQGSLLAFVNQIEAFLKTDKLTPARGNPLIYQASSIWDQLNQ